MAICHSNDEISGGSFVTHIFLTPVGFCSERVVSSPNLLNVFKRKSTYVEANVPIEVIKMKYEDHFTIKCRIKYKTFFILPKL